MKRSTNKLSETYDILWDGSYGVLKSGSVEIDNHIDSTKDQRYGITLLARPYGPIKSEIRSFLQQLSLIEPNQYYYPDSDLHVTVLSVISCFDGFRLDQIDRTAYCSVILNSLQKIGPFDIRFHGVTASRSAILIQGFPADDTLETLRNRLRQSFHKSGLLSSIDSRYRIQTAHVTAIRFCDKLTYPISFLKKLEEHRYYNFGMVKVDRLELVFSDWYQRRSKTVKLADFELLSG